MKPVAVLLVVALVVAAVPLVRPMDAEAWSLAELLPAPSSEFGWSIWLVLEILLDPDGDTITWTELKEMYNEEGGEGGADVPDETPDVAGP